MGRSLFLIVAAALFGVQAGPVTAQDEDRFLIVAHRGASAERPEHTLAAYERAIDQGADYIEPDLVATKDLVLVARHENELSGTTDVAEREEFEDRRRTKEIDGQKVAGWFAEDFTLAELRTLRTKERIPSVRPDNARFDGLYSVPTLAEIVQLIRAKETAGGRRIGLYPELKHSNFLLQAEGIDMVDLLLKEFRTLGIEAGDPVYVQSFEIAPLRRLSQRSDFRLVQLIGPSGGPADEPDLRFADMVSPTGLAQIATYADIVGVPIPLILNANGSATSLVSDATTAGLPVHAWTLRPENTFLPASLRAGTDPNAIGCGAFKLALMLEEAGVRGVFTDAAIEPCAKAEFAPG